jgi:hypothetical protein
VLAHAGIVVADAKTGFERFTTARTGFANHLDGVTAAIKLAYALTDLAFAAASPSTSDPFHGDQNSKRLKLQLKPTESDPSQLALRGVSGSS